MMTTGRAASDRPPARAPRRSNRHWLKRLAACAAGLGAAQAWIGCAPRPPSFPSWDGPERESARLEPEERELRGKAEAALDALTDEGLVVEDEILSNYLQSIVERLVPTTADTAPRPRVIVIASAGGNAAALADGTITFDLPLLASFPDEAQVAFVLAHEIAHILRRHALLSARYGSSTPSHVHRMDLSRRLESEADRMAVGLLAAAGYDVRVAPSALLHLQRLAPTTPDPIRAWSSHGPIRQRAAVVERAVEDLDASDGERRADEFQRAMDRVRLDAATIELEADRPEPTLALVHHHLEREPRSARAHLLRARIAIAMDPSTRRSEAVGADLRAAVEYSPGDSDALRALGLFLRDTGETDASNAILRRYLDARPDAVDRKIIERYLTDRAAGPDERAVENP